MSSIILSIGIVFLSLSPLFSLDPVAKDTIRTYHLEDSVVVIAKRYQLSVKSVTNSSEILPVKEYEGVAVHSALQLADMISPQVFVLEKKVMGYGIGPNGSGNIYMRGLGGKPNTGILVLINGRPDFMAIFGHPLPDVYGLNDIEQVEVIKGPSSTIFGSNAMGGVINLVTAKPASKKVSANIQAGSFRTFTQNLQLGTEINRTRFQLYAGHQKTAGHIDSSGFEGWIVGGKVYRPFSKNWVMNLDGKYVPFNFNDPFMGEDLADLGYYGKIRRGMVDLNIEGTTGKLQNSFHLYTNLGHHRFNDGFESHDFSYGFSSYQYLKLSPESQLSFGLDALHYGGKAFNVVPPGIFPRPDLHTVNSLGGYLVGFYTPQSKISLQGGLRLQYTSLNINRVTPTAGLSVQPLNQVRLYANYNEAFRLPTLQELYLFPSSNPELEPESAKSFEFGAFFYFWKQDFFKIALFQNDVKNIIGLLGVPPNISYQNSAEANQSGVELQLHHQPHKNINIRLSHSYINPDDLIAFNPRNQFKYWLALNFRNIGFSVFGKYVSDLYAENSQESRLSDYFLMNLSLDYRYRMFSLTLQLMNLLDRRYEVLMNYPAPGFHFLAGIKISLPSSIHN